MASFGAIWNERSQNTFGKLAKSSVACGVSGNNNSQVVVWKQIQNYVLYAPPINKYVHQYPS